VREIAIDPDRRTLRRGAIELEVLAGVVASDIQARGELRADLFEPSLSIEGAMCAGSGDHDDAILAQSPDR